MGRERVLLVEDEPGIRELIEMYLDNRGYDVITAKNGEEGIELATSENPQIILLDIEMPGIDGFEVCKAIRQKMTVPIIFISCRKDVMDKLTCFELGGDDYLTKPFDFAELEARMGANLRRYTTSEGDQLSNVIQNEHLKVDPNSARCFIKDELVDLSAKEMQLLILLAKHPNQIWSHEQLYNYVWGFDYAGDINTVKVHISNLRRKLEDNPSKPQYIQTVRGFGYLFATEL